MPSESTTRRVTDGIRDRLRAAKISQEQVASALQLSQQAVSRRLAGDVDLSVAELTTIAELLDVEPAELLEVA